jgi:hypothetical protein
MTEEAIKIRINLTDNTKKMFEALKEEYNLDLNTEVMRLIIKIAYDNKFKDKDKD